MEVRPEVSAAAPGDGPAERADGRLAPLPPESRIDVVDALRGVALLGILLVNIAYFSEPLVREFLPDPEPPSAVDRAARFVVRMVAETKFYSMFALLFGFGLAIQMGRAQQRGAAFVPYFLRRMLVLLGFAVAHVVLLWYGDILHAYALLGCLLLLFRNCRQQTLIAWACGLLLVPTVALAGVTGIAYALARPAGGPAATAPASAPPRGAGDASAPESASASGSTSTSAPAGADSASAPASAGARAGASGESASFEERWKRLLEEWYRRETEAFQRGGFTQQLERRVKNFVTSASLLVTAYPAILAMFLAGMWTARKGILHAPDAHRRRLAAGAWLGLGVGLPLNAVYAYSVDASRGDNQLAGLIAATLAFVAGPVLCVGYVSAIVLLMGTPAGRACLRPITFVGRMTLSNYLLESVLCTTIFYSYGLGLFGKLGPAATAGIALLVYAALIPWSVWWLSRFRFGPAEWLWRSLTYGRRLPMLAAAGPPIAAS